MNKITILLVDDHKLIRDSWSFILNSDPRFAVVGETSSVEEALGIAKNVVPDIILMDVNMSPVNGFEATRELKKKAPASRIIGVSMHAMPAYVKQMFRVGAMGYVTKNSSKDEMINAILEVSEGKKFMCQEVKNLMDQPVDKSSDVPAISILTKRENDVAELIKQGLFTREIAEKLDISTKTVEVHRYNILKKLDLKNSAALVNYLNEHGL